MEPLDNDTYSYQSEEEKKKKEPSLEHYYGDIVRALFMGGGAVLMFAILRDRQFLTFYLVVGVFLVLAITLLAGYTNPLSRKVIAANVVISGIMFVLFEYLAAFAYTDHPSFTDEFFLLRQVLAVVFLIALYYSTKTYRGMKDTSLPEA